MKVDLFPFQKTALYNLRSKTAEALGSYLRTKTPQVVSYTAPTGAGKTIILSSLIESIFFGDENYPEQPEAIFIWLSDSPELNQQSKNKINYKSDKINLTQTITITDDTFDKEVLEDGNIYFLNTQKLSISSNLTKHSDKRQYTIWETISNTVEKKSDHLYFIIDEAHRGTLGKEAGRQTSIMQKFVKGSKNDGLPAMPVVIGVSATIERFNNLVSADTISTIHKVITTADEVRQSGLLKDKIIITYPDTVNNDMAVLQAAADEWKEKWEHWSIFCREQHHSNINPIFVIQVKNGTSTTITETDLGDAITKIQERTGFKFKDGEVVHTFGDNNGLIHEGGVNIIYAEPSSINDNREIKVVFFKENLSTGWDCPRAETMMSFRNANDSTYIAQLLGRMVRTPTQSHIDVDDTLNDVHLYLPYFNADTVKSVVDALKSAEGESIPTEVYQESTSENIIETWTVRKTPPRSFSNSNLPSEQESQTQVISNSANNVDSFALRYDNNQDKEQTVTNDNKIGNIIPSSSQQSDVNSKIYKTDVNLENKTTENPVVNYCEPSFDREEVTKAINSSTLLTYVVRPTRINNYLKSAFSLARLVTQSGIDVNAKNNLLDGCVDMIHNHIKTLKSNNKYEELVEKVMEFKLNIQVFDVFGQKVETAIQQDLFSTDTDIERQFRQAEHSLGNEGIANTYVQKYLENDDYMASKINVIIFSADTECIRALHNYAENKYHEINNSCRRQIVRLDEALQHRYDEITRDGDAVSEHNFKLPETIASELIRDGEEYTNHLYANDNGIAKISLNTWEKGVLQEEEKKPDFVTWLRNPPRKYWSLCIPYEINGETHPTFPDLLIIRKDANGYIFDILEPHDPSRKDNLGKAIGFAKYANINKEVNRIQLIREVSDITGKKFKRLDMANSQIRNKVLKCISNDELDHIFEIDGHFE